MTTANLKGSLDAEAAQRALSAISRLSQQQLADALAVLESIANYENWPDSEEAVQGRVNRFCDWVGVEPPVEIFDDAGAPTRCFIDFCVRGGADFNWIMCGDVRKMVLDTKSFKQMRRRVR